MSSLSYKEYVDILKDPPESHTIYKVAVFVTIILSFLMVGAASALIFYNQKIAPKVQASIYIQTATNGIYTSKQSLDEMLESFKVAGANTNAIGNPGDLELAYEIDLENRQKILLKVENTQKVINSQQEFLQNSKLPTQFRTLHKGLEDFYSQSNSLLGQAQKDHKFFIDIAMALGQDFYMPTFSNDDIWKGNPKDLRTYFESKRIKAQESFNMLYTLTPQEDFWDYYNDELAFLGLYVKVSTDIINTLNTSPSLNVTDPTQTEKAYQQLANAQKEAEEIAKKIQSDRQRLVKLKDNLDKFAPLRYQANTLESQLKDLNTLYIEENKPTNFYQQLIKNRFHAT